MKKTMLYTLLMAAVVGSCNRKDPDVKPVPKVDSGKVKMRFSNVVGTQPLTFKSDWYKNAKGDSFNVTLFTYYISNIQLNRADGSGAYVQPNSYYLLDGYNRPETLNFDIDSVANGKYNSITLTIGVDSAANTTGAHTGALDQIWGYYWGWNAGYIFMKFEGQTSKDPLEAKTLQYHVGGYLNPSNAIRTVTLPLPNAIEIAPGKTATIEAEANVLKLFETPNQIDFTRLQKVHTSGAEAMMIADNYASMLRIKASGNP